MSDIPSEGDIEVQVKGTDALGVIRPAYVTETNRLSVDAQVSGNLSLGQDFVPKIEQFYTPIALTVGYQDIFSLTGKGAIKYFRFQFFNMNWYLKIIVDGITGYEIRGDQFSNFNFGLDLEKEATAPLKVAEDGRDMSHNFDPPINYETSFKIQMKYVSSGARVDRGFLKYRVVKV